MLTNVEEMVPRPRITQPADRSIAAHQIVIHQRAATGQECAGECHRSGVVQAKAVERHQQRAHVEGCLIVQAISGQEIGAQIYNALIQQASAKDSGRIIECSLILQDSQQRSFHLIERGGLERAAALVERPLIIEIDGCSRQRAALQVVGGRVGDRGVGNGHVPHDVAAPGLREDGRAAKAHKLAGGAQESAVQ